MTDEQGTALATKDGALKGAAVSAAVAAAVYGLRRALAANEGHRFTRTTSMTKGTRAARTAAPAAALS